MCSASKVILVQLNIKTEKVCRSPRFLETLFSTSPEDFFVLAVGNCSFCILKSTQVFPGTSELFQA